MQNTELATVENKSMISVIEKAISNPEIDATKLNGLLDFQLRIMAEEARMAFDQAMARLQPKLPIIPKNGAIIYGGKSQPYAKYEDIDALIRPLLNAEGFHFDFDSEETDKGVVYIGELHHAMGHKRTRRFGPLPADTSGGKNAIQAVGSTLSYAKRYLVGMLLNLITKDEDDDASSIGTINDEQLKEIELLIIDTDSDKVRFLKYIGVEKLSDIKARDYQKAITVLKQKGSKK